MRQVTGDQQLVLRRNSQHQLLRWCQRRGLLQARAEVECFLHLRHRPQALGPSDWMIQMFSMRRRRTDSATMQYQVQYLVRAGDRRLTKLRLGRQTARSSILCQSMDANDQRWTYGKVEFVEQLRRRPGYER